MKILFLTNIPSPYRVHFFNELGKLCDLTVVFERGASSERDSSWKTYNTEHFTPIFLRGIAHGVANAFCPGVIKHLTKDHYDHVIVTNFTSPTGMLAIAWLRMKKIPYWLESDGGFPKSGTGFKEKLKKYFMKGAAGYFSTADMHDQYYLQYGAAPDRIHRYPFTSLYQRDILDTPVTTEQKQVLRDKLGMKEQKILLAVGQFIHRKGFDVLMDAMAALPKDVGCYIVGGTPTESYLEQVNIHNLDHVHFVGFQSKEVLADFYLASDVFVLPTREDIWGLVINEAMAKGLPVITTDRCIAGLELVTEPGNGTIVPVGDAQTLAQAISRALDHTCVQDSEQILKKINKYSFEEMASRHIEILTAF